jgi:uncharacterized protein (TIGR00725 family)
MPKQLIGVIGGHAANTTRQAILLAERVGEEIGRRGMGVICGGEDGIMEAACRGCRGSGGVTIGVLKGNVFPAERSYLDFAILTSMDVASNNVLIWSSRGVVALDGRFGTLNEMALALDFGRPLVSIGVQRLLRPENVPPESRFTHFEGYDVDRVPGIIDHLESMIRADAT